MNLELWNEAVDWIEGHPEEYAQSKSGLGYVSRECKSPCCFFGTVAALCGLRALDGCDLRSKVGWFLRISDSRRALTVWRNLACELV